MNQPAIERLQDHIIDTMRALVDLVPIGDRFAVKWLDNGCQAQFDMSEFKFVITSELANMVYEFARLNQHLSTAEDFHLKLARTELAYLAQADELLRTGLGVALDFYDVIMQDDYLDEFATLVHQVSTDFKYIWNRQRYLLNNYPSLATEETVINAQLTATA